MTSQYVSTGQSIGIIRIISGPDLSSDLMRWPFNVVISSLWAATIPERIEHPKEISIFFNAVI